MQTLWYDLRYAARRLGNDRWITLAAVVALALGIGANSTVFTIVNAVILRSLPFEQADRVMWIDTKDTQGRTFGASLQDFEDWRRASRTFSEMALLWGGNLNLSADERVPERYPGPFITASGLRLIGARAALGRSLTEDDDRLGAPPVALISDTVWKNRYGADPSIIGKSVLINAVPATIVGVMPEGFGFPFVSEVWMPLSQLSPALRQRGRQQRAYLAFGRLADGVTLEQARSEMTNLSTQLAEEHQDTNKDIIAVVTPFGERIIGPQFRTLLWSLMGAVAFVLFIACSNVANLLLARAASRSREMAVRVSQGATRWRIVRQLLVESVLLSCIGGFVGLGLTLVGIRWFEASLPDGATPYWMVFSLDARVFAFFAVVSVLTGVLFGLAPALHVSRIDVNDLLKEGGRSGSAGVRARRWTGGLIVIQLTLTLILLAGAGYMTRSFLKLYQVDLGMNPAPVLTMTTTVSTRKYPTMTERMAFFDRLEDRLNTVGTVAGASINSHAPLFGGLPRQLTIDGRPAAAQDRPAVVTTVSISSRYFDSLGVGLVRGRPFDHTDGEAGHEAVIINQQLAMMYFPGEDPIGQRLRLRDDAPGVAEPAWATIVGLVPNVRQRSAQDPDPDPVAYIPNRQNPLMAGGWAPAILVRAHGNPAALTAQLRQEALAFDPDMPLANVRPLEDLLALQRWGVRTFGTMFAVFAAIALVLAAVGLYAVTAYSVNQRRQEIGIRMALGAERRQISWLILRRGLVYLATGLVLGLAGARAVGALLRSWLVQIEPGDPTTLAAISLLLASVAIVACLWPSWRATRIDPAVTLRAE